jgi:hypothetical protein
MPPNNKCPAAVICDEASPSNYRRRRCHANLRGRSKLVPIGAFELVRKVSAFSLISEAMRCVLRKSAAIWQEQFASLFTLQESLL